MALTQITNLSVALDEAGGTKYLIATLKSADFEEGAKVYIADLDADIDVSTELDDLFDQLLLLV